MEEIEEAYHKIHDQLAIMPIDYCFWKKTSELGVTAKTLGADYRPVFYFVSDRDMRYNIAELRFCIDYYRSLLSLHKPGLTFGWHHKLVIYQLIGAIYEGLMWDLCFNLTITWNNNKLSAALWKNRINKMGLGQLSEYLHQANIISEEWKEYIDNLKHARDTVHPRSLNSQRSNFRQNPVVRDGIPRAIDKLDEFITLIKLAHSIE